MRHGVSLNTHLPPLAWHYPSAPDIQSVEALGEGDFCACYLVNCTHVVRLAKHAEASASLQREMLLLPHLAGRVGVPIPQIQGSGTRMDTGEQFVFYPLLPGTILEVEVLSSLERTCRSELVRQMAGFVTWLHGFPVEIARSCGLAEVDPRRYLPELMRRAGDTISHRLDAAVWRYYRWLAELYLDTPELHTYTPALLHGDLSPGHFLADLDRCVLTGVIDFGDCFIGDPHRDLIYLLEDYGQDVLDLFLTFYSPETKQQASRHVQVLQQLDNVEYCIAKLAEGDPQALEEAIRTLVTQATTQAVV
jgi:aminoglycoside 2''-phosphotransferase